MVVTHRDQGPGQARTKPSCQPSAAWASTRTAVAAREGCHGPASKIGQFPNQVTERVDVLGQVAVAKELVPDPLMSVAPQPLPHQRVLEKHLKPLRNGGQVVRIREQQAVAAVDDLVLDAADRTRQHRTALPQSLGHGQPETLEQTF